MNKVVAYLRDGVNSIYLFLEKIADHRILFSIIIRDLIKLMAPITPHICEEAWGLLGFDGLVSDNPWPSYKKEYLKVDVINLPVQVNGKLRGTICIDCQDGEEIIFEKAMQIPSVQKAISGNLLKKKIFVKGKIVNFVV
jgi:leucyl-tRNA synthetase